MWKSTIDLSDINSPLDFTSTKTKMVRHNRLHFEMPEISRLQAYIIAGVVACVLFASMMMIIFSFVYIEWNQYALKKNDANNKVDIHHTYENGRHFWGLARSPIRFNNLVTTVEFAGDDPLVIFTEGGLEMKIDCSFQWKIIKDKLPELYKNYGLTYPVQIVSIARSILKNVAPNFTMDEYYEQRDVISASMFNILKEQLGEKMSVEVAFFQLNFVQLPHVVLSKLLNIAVQNQINIKEQYVQQAAIIRENTNSLVAEIVAESTVIKQTADSNASFIRNQAKATSFELLQKAKKEGYDILFRELGLETSDLQLSFLYVTGIMQSESDVKLFVDVNSIIIPQ